MALIRLRDLPAGLGAAILALLLAFACSGGVSEREGSETHFLRSCDMSCPAGAVCMCGVCSAACDDALDCAPLGAEAVCTISAPRVAELRCGSQTPASFCDVGCVLDADCTRLGAPFRCHEGFCREREPVTLPNRACPAQNLLPSDVLVVGDALIELSPFTAELEGHAVAAGLLADGQHYRESAAGLTSLFAEGPFSLLNQYLSAREQGNAKRVVLDGGATDVLNNPCDGNPSPTCPAIVAAVSGAEQLFEQLAADGVEHVTYFFYPDFTEKPELKSSIDVLRPLLQNLCGKSKLACHWLDLRAAFAGRRDYLAADDIVLSASGAAVAASSVFELMRKRCAL